MKYCTTRQSVFLRAKPESIYRTLMVSRLHAAFTGSTARISPKVGGTFTSGDGYIHGRNLKLVPGKKIVQDWRPSEEGWPRGYHSKVTFLLTPTRGGTRLTFSHSGVPEEFVDELASGWKLYYWEPLKLYLASTGGTA